MRATHYRYIPLGLSLLLLAGAAADMLRRPRPSDAEPFHQRIREIGNRLAQQEIEGWTSRRQKMEQSATALLRPNFELQREFTRVLPDQPAQRLSLMIIQCKDARDMIGHNPLNCYPCSNWQLVGVSDVDWTVRDSSGAQRVVPGREYEFVKQEGGYQMRRQFVDHLIILPDGRLVRRVEEINAAEADRSRRFYGAAQIQLLFNESFTEEQRRAIFAEVIGAHMELIDALSGGKK